MQSTRAVLPGIGLVLGVGLGGAIGLVVSAIGDGDAASTMLLGAGVGALVGLVTAAMVARRSRVSLSRLGASIAVGATVGLLFGLMLGGPILGTILGALIGAAVTMAAPDNDEGRIGPRA